MCLNYIRITAEAAMSSKLDLIKPSLAAGARYVKHCNGKSQEILPEVSITDDDDGKDDVLILLWPGHTHRVPTEEEE